MILKALAHYDIPEQALEFYRVHVEAEEEHGGNAEQAVAPFVQTAAQQALVRHAFRWTVVALAGMQTGFDAVLDA
jgi:pyrroloquinoline quinone (PQQ) biosynthesis protein C